MGVLPPLLRCLPFSGFIFLSCLTDHSEQSTELFEPWARINSTPEKTSNFEKNWTEFKWIKELKSRCPLKIEHEMKPIHAPHATELNSIKLKCFCIFWLNVSQILFFRLFQLAASDMISFQVAACYLWKLWSVWAFFSLLLLRCRIHGERQTNNLYVKKHKKRICFLTESLNSFTKLFRRFINANEWLNPWQCFVIPKQTLRACKRSRTSYRPSVDERVKLWWYVACAFFKIQIDLNRFRWNLLLSVSFCVGIQFAPYDKMLIRAITYVAVISFVVWIWFCLRKQTAFKILNSNFELCQIQQMSSTAIDMK